jgi:Tfp pilus assembly protein PilV
MQSPAVSINSPGTLKTTVNKSERGFTLIETSIALVVLMVAALAIAALFSYAINYNSGAYERTLALAIAQKRMEKLRKGSFAEVVSSTEDVPANEAVQSTPSGTPSARYFYVETIVTGTTFKNITVRVTPESATQKWSSNPIVIISQRADTSVGTYY